VRLRVETECQAEVRLQAALVELVEHHAGHAFQGGVSLQHPGEDAFGDDLDPRAWTNACFKPRAVADEFAGFFAAQHGHASCDRTGGDPPRFQHEDALVLPPRLLLQEQRDDGALAGPGRGLEDHPVVK